MRRASVVVAAVAVVVLAGCSTAPSIIAESSTAPQVEQLVWVGTGTSWVFEDGEWLRTPEQDYELLVRQNRHVDRWESLKVQNRTHPA